MSEIRFEGEIYKIHDWKILRLPKEASLKLPSRGMTMVEGTINGFAFKTVLEPNGKGSHWFEINESLQIDANIKAGDTVKLAIESSKEWIEPEVPEDLKIALKTSTNAQELWNDITPIARWDWVRWVRAVKTAETRVKHIDVMISKLSKGMRRPCCFNRSMCSVPEVSKNWVLLV